MKDIKSKGTYSIIQDNYTLSIDYIYYLEWGDYETQGSEDLEITAVYLDEADITDFYWDYLLDRLDEEVIEYARDNT